MVGLDDIEWIEARGDYVRVHSAGRVDLVRETISGVERRLPPSRFVRIHRSTIVSIAKVKEIRLLPGRAGRGAPERGPLPAEPKREGSAGKVVGRAI